MKFLVWLLLLFAAAVSLTVASHNPGYVQLVYPPYRAEMSLTLFVLSLLVLFLVGYASLRLLIAAFNLPDYVRAFRKNRALEQRRTALTETMTAYFEGRYAAAESAAVRARESGDTSGLPSVIAARAAHELRAFERRDSHLVAAENESADAATMRLMAKAEFQLDQKQPQSALNSLKELAADVRKQTGVLALELKAQQQLGDWDAVLNAVAQLSKRNAIDAILAQQLQQRAWLEKLREPSLDIEALRNLWKAIPAEFKPQPKITVTAAQAFLKLQEPASACKLLTDSLNAQWDSDLVALYGDCNLGKVSAQINQAERWLQTHTDDAGLLLALGKLCLHQELWGKAQSYLDASISLQPSSAAYNALGKLAEKLGNNQAAFDYFHQAMELEETHRRTSRPST